MRSLNTGMKPVFRALIRQRQSRHTHGKCAEKGAILDAMRHRLDNEAAERGARTNGTDWNRVRSWHHSFDWNACPTWTFPRLTK